MKLQTTNTRCLIEAAKRLGLPYEIFDKNGNFLRFRAGDKNLDFINYATPFNMNSFSKMTKDKEFTYFLVSKAVSMPKTLAFIDPNYDEGGEIKPEPKTLESMTDEIVKEFSLPVVVKPNSLSGGKNYFLCEKKENIITALEKIFYKNKNYDYLALAQEYVIPKEEYRVVVFKNKVEIVYTRKAYITDKKIINEMEDFINPIFPVLSIGFAGLDVIVSKTGEKYLLEINSEPGFSNLVAKSGDEPLIEMYCRMLRSALI